MLAVPMRILNSAKYKNRGKALFDSKTDVLDGLDEVISQWMDAIRMGRIKRYIPDSLIPRDPETGKLMPANPFDNDFIAIGDDMSEKSNKQVEISQPQISYEAYVNSYASFLDLVLQGVISPSTLGIDLKKTDNADSQREKEKITLEIRGKIVDTLNKVLPQLFTAVLQCYDLMCGKVPGKYEPSIKFGEYALLKATSSDMQKAEKAVLRRANDQYRKIIFNAQVYAATGAGTYEKAVDMATKDFLSAGIDCIEYANGSRHTIADYADMAIRTASKRAYLQGEGTKRQEWGLHLVIMNKRGNPCPKCLPFCGKILMGYVFAHETSHRMDELEYHSWENEKFLQAIESCSKKVYSQKEEIQKWFELGGKYENSFALSDIISALSDGSIDVPVGHKKDYWRINQKYKPMEIFANLSSIDVLNLQEKEKVIKELIEVYEEMVG